MIQEVGTRRTALRSIALVASAPAIITTAWAAPAPVARTSPRLTRAIALHRRAEAECDRFDRMVERPACEAYAAEMTAYPAEPPPPHEEVATTFINYEYKVVRLSTGGVGSRSIGEKLLNDPTWADMGDDDWRQAHLELTAAHERRDAIIAEHAARLDAYKREARSRLQLDAIVARSNSLGERRYDLWLMIVKMPVSSIHDLAEKLAFIERHDDDPTEFEFAAVAADIKRIAGGEA